MENTNQFGKLLEHLLTVTGLKNYVLAQALQYDVSYISKWVNGKKIPAEKNAEKILRGISGCITHSLNEESRNSLYTEFRVDTDSALETILYTELTNNYNHDLSLTKSLTSQEHSSFVPSGSTNFYEELSMLQFAMIMKNPILNGKETMEIAAMFDVLSMGHEYRMAITEIDTTQSVTNEHGDYPDVHFSILINLNVGRRNYIYDSLFLINMLTVLSQVDLKLYEDDRAFGKYIFAVKDAYSVSGMSIDTKNCLAVTTSDDSTISNVLYHRVLSLCTRERILFHNTTMISMLNKHVYSQYMLSGRLQWLIGHMTEYFLPEDMFEKILPSVDFIQSEKVPLGSIKQVHYLSQQILENATVQIEILEVALTNFVFTGELDFYDTKIILSISERLRYIEAIEYLLQKNENLTVKIIHGDLVKDYKYVTTSCMLLSDSISYLRLGRKNYRNNMVLMNNPHVKTLFSNFFDTVWKESPNIVYDTEEDVAAVFSHMKQTLHLLSH